MAESKHTFEVELTIDATEAIKTLRATADMLEALKPKPEPIKVGDYVRLTGERWGEHMGKVVRVARAESETEYAAVKIDGSVWYITPDWTVDRITVTADLDDPWNLPMPEVGEWVWVESCYFSDDDKCGEIHIAGAVASIDSNGQMVVDGTYVGFAGTPVKYEILRQVTAWGLYDPADLTPAEPTTFGYVGYVTDADGDVWDLLRDGEGDFMGVLRSEVVGYQVIKWPDVLELGTFTAVER